MPKKVEKSLPDEIRCRRNDGRKWRCPRRVVDGKKLCHIHYDQGRQRRLKQKDPDHLKLERKSKKICKDVMKKISLSGIVEKAVRIAGLKNGDERLELTRDYLKLLVEAKKKKECNHGDEEEVENTLVLPFGVMAISKRNTDNAGPSIAVDVKIEEASSSNPHSIRAFRSKTIEPRDLFRIGGKSN